MDKVEEEVVLARKRELRGGSYGMGWGEASGRALGFFPWCLFFDLLFLRLYLLGVCLVDLYLRL